MPGESHSPSHQDLLGAGFGQQPHALSWTPGATQKQASCSLGKQLALDLRFWLR